MLLFIMRVMSLAAYRVNLRMRSISSPRGRSWAVGLLTKFLGVLQWLPTTIRSRRIRERRDVSSDRTAWRTWVILNFSLWPEYKIIWTALKKGGGAGITSCRTRCSCSRHNIISTVHLCKYWKSGKSYGVLIYAQFIAVYTKMIDKSNHAKIVAIIIATLFLWSKCTTKKIDDYRIRKCMR